MFIDLKLNILCLLYNVEINNFQKMAEIQYENV